MSKELLSKNLKFLRKRYSLSQEDLAARVRASRALVGAWEEQRSEPGYLHYFRLCDLFHMKTDRDLITLDLEAVHNNPLLRTKHLKKEPDEMKALRKILEIAQETIKL